MTDIRRTLLWGIFLASLFFLWESWNRHNGQPSMFGPPPRVAAPGAASPSTAPAPTPVPGRRPSRGRCARRRPPLGVPVAAAPAASAPATSQQVTVSTDLVRATIDSTGATLARVELLKQVDPLDKSKHVVLLDRSASRLYLAETGLVPPAGGAGLPNHHTPMRVLPGERSLGDGQNELKVAFESDPVGGVKLVKTYTFRRGDYVIGVQHQIVNASNAPINPRLYLQLVRDGNDPPGGSSLYFTFTGPGIYTETSHYNKIDFSSIAKRAPGEKPNHETSGSNGWVAMVQHYFLSAWLVDKPGAPGPAREFFTAKIDANTYSVGELLPMGEIAPGATKDLRCAPLRRPAGRRHARQPCARPRAGQGLRLVHDPRQAAVLAADAAAQADRQLGLVDRRPGRAAQDRLLLAQRESLQLDGEDEGDQPARHGNARAPEGQAAADAAGDDAHLPRGEGQPARRLPADPGADAVLHRPLLGAAVDGRDEERALDRLDH